MLSKTIFFILATWTSLANGQQDCSNSQTYYTAAQNQYIFSAFDLSAGNGFDGPSSCSGAATTQSTTPWTQSELMYYNYFAASMYCTYTLPSLSCCYCAQFNSSVTYFKIFENTNYGTKAMVTLHPSKSEIVVAFRGSVTVMNWLLDIFFLQVKSSPDIKIHRGNYLQVMSLYNEVVGEVGRLITANPSYRVVITGQSLGGAMASLFSFFVNYLDQFPGTTNGLITYGQPRVGNKGYADFMNGLDIQMARVVARADIVPHAVPVSAFGILSLLGTYYVHHGQEVWINGATTKFCSKTVYEDFSCSNSMGPAYSIFDHGQYFDVDYTTCLAFENAGPDFFTLPGFTPTNYIPPMPTKMQNYFGPYVQGGYQGLLPSL